MRSTLTVILSTLAILSSQAVAEDIVKISVGKSSQDTRAIYTDAILRQALELSADKFGPYQIEKRSSTGTPIRTMQEVRRGSIINMAMAYTTREWESETIPIRIPIRLGALNYRLLLIDKENQHLFDDITTVDELRALKAGLRNGWATGEVLKAKGFNVVEGISYDGLFEMLDKGRFDYIPRGFHEVYDEMYARQVKLPNLTVENHLVLFIPAPYYIFVSPKEPRLAERLEYGLERMVEQDAIRTTFMKFYSHSFKISDLGNRTLINIGNPELSDETPFDRPELWLNFQHREADSDAD